MKKILLFCIVGILLCYSVLTFAVDNYLPYVDIDDVSWAHEAIAYFYYSSPGDCSTQFKPHYKLERGDTLFVLVNLFGLYSNEKSDTNFNDVGVTYYRDTVGIAKKLGIVLGDGNNNFYPKRNFTREDFAVVMYRAMSVLDAELNNESNVSSFQDSDIADYAKEAITMLHKYGIINGCGNGYFLPKKELTRAEFAKMTYEAMKYLGLLKEI